MTFQSPTVSVLAEIGSSVRGLVRFWPLSIGHRSKPSSGGSPASAAMWSTASSPASVAYVTHQSASIA